MYVSQVTAVALPPMATIPHCDLRVKLFWTCHRPHVHHLYLPAADPLLFVVEPSAALDDSGRPLAASPVPQGHGAGAGAKTSVIASEGPLRPSTPSGTTSAPGVSQPVQGGSESPRPVLSRGASVPVRISAMSPVASFTRSSTFVRQVDTYRSFRSDGLRASLAVDVSHEKDDAMWCAWGWGPGTPSQEAVAWVCATVGASSPFLLGRALARPRPAKAELSVYGTALAPLYNWVNMYRTIPLFPIPRKLRSSLRKRHFGARHASFRYSGADGQAEQAEGAAAAAEQGYEWSAFAMPPSQSDGSDAEARHAHCCGEDPVVAAWILPKEKPVPALQRHLKGIKLSIRTANIDVRVPMSRFLRTV